MTSIYEGVPYVVFEAMAMGLPVVAPALPGNVELLGELSGGLVEPRDDVAGYVDRLTELIEDRGRRREIGDRVRERVTGALLAPANGRRAQQAVRPVARAALRRRPTATGRAPRSPIRFQRRGLYEAPLVSVIVPCFNHGRFLRECVDAVRTQTHQAVETIVVDDALYGPRDDRGASTSSIAIRT